MERIIGWGVHPEDPYVKLTIRTTVKEYEFLIGPGFGADFASMFLSVSVHLRDEISERLAKSEVEE